MSALVGESSNCQMQMSQEGITVGERFKMTCATTGQTMKEPVQVEFLDANDKHSLSVVKILNQNNQQIEFEVSGYRPGSYKELEFVITDGTLRLKSQPQTWQVKSVIQNPQQEPIPSFGPFGLSYPLWFWISLVLVALLAIGGVVFWIMRSARRRRMLEELNKYQTMLSPFNQFSKDMRGILRALQNANTHDDAAEVFKKLDDDFRLYLIRELKIPAFELSNSEILKEIKKYHRNIYELWSVDLRRILLELERGKKSNKKIETRDCDQLLVLSRRIGEGINDVRRKRS